MLKDQYLNNERNLYEYIKNNLDTNGKCVFTYQTIMDEYSVSLQTVYRWNKRLRDNGLINSSIHVVNGRKMCFASLIEG